MTAKNLEVGAVVVSADGKQLGVVKAILNDRFKLERKLLSDYWLATEYVDHAGEGLVQMILTKEGIGAAKVEAPYS
jgi:hypothetical protein